MCINCDAPLSRHIVSYEYKGMSKEEVLICPGQLLDTPTVCTPECKTCG